MTALGDILPIWGRSGHRIRRLPSHLSDKLRKAERIVCQSRWVLAIITCLKVQYYSPPRRESCTEFYRFAFPTPDYLEVGHAALLRLTPIASCFCSPFRLPPAQPKPTPPNPQAPVLAPLVISGGQRGAKVELQLTGTNLAGPTGLFLDFPAKIDIPKGDKNGEDNAKLKVVIDIPADAPIGPHILRLATTRGMSNLRVFSVDDLPQVLDGDKNQDKATAQDVPVPCVRRAHRRRKPLVQDQLSAGSVSFVVGRRLGRIDRNFLLTPRQSWPTTTTRPAVRRLPSPSRSRTQAIIYAGARHLPQRPRLLLPPPHWRLPSCHDADPMTAKRAAEGRLPAQCRWRRGLVGAQTSHPAPVAPKRSGAAAGPSSPCPI